MKNSLTTALALVALGSGCGQAQAAEAFQLRYNIAGSLGGEMFGAPDRAGLAAGIAWTDIVIDKVTGDDGHALTATLPGGTVALPAPAPAALYPTYAPTTATVASRGTQRQWNLAVGYVSTDTYGGGRLAFGVNVPYATKKQDIDVTATPPALQWNPAVPAATQAAVNAAFDTRFDGGLAAQSAASTGEVSALGDTDLQFGWLHAGEQLRMLAGVSLVLPTGQYATGPAPNIGFGHFYTLRPAFQAAWLPVPDVAFSGKLTVGLNTRNSANHLRSGDWVGFEAAAGYRTPVGPVGLHMVAVRQFQDDDGNPFGTSRLSSTNVGAFFTTRLPVVDAVLTLQTMVTAESRNARSGTYSQARVIKLF
jgi:hypothetical protein